MKITCHQCNQEAKTGLNEVKDFRGNCFAVVCDNCSKKIHTLLDKLFTKYGGVKGKCSCWNSPNISSVNQLEKVLDSN